MVKIFSQTHRYEDAWPTVALAFFLRYPNRYASHVVSADVLSRTISPRGTLLTTRLILKRGALPAWFPRGLVSRAESWIIEESEVDPAGRVLLCSTRNLDHRTVMEVVEHTELREAEDGSTIHKTEARFVSGLGWGLKKRIEEYSASRFKANIEKSRLGLALVVRLLREARLNTLPFKNRMIQGQDGNNELPNGTMTANGARWSYSDIHAAAIASSSSFASGSTTTSTSEPTTTSNSTATSNPSTTSNSASVSTSVSRDRSRQGSPLRDRCTDDSGTTSRSSMTGPGGDGSAPPADANAGGWGSWLW